VPEVYHFDRTQALIVMEFMAGHRILRRDLIDGVEHPGIAGFLGRFCARTLFLSSDLGMPTPERKADLALFAANVALCDITENLVFTDPYRDAPLNRHTTPQLDALAAELRADAGLKVEAQHLKAAFCGNAEALLHGDLHTGSIMAAGEHAVVIDPEFAAYGPMGFDVGMLISNFLMAYHAQPGHEARRGERSAFGAGILETARGIWSSFAAEFADLWRTRRTGILYPATLFEDQGQALAAEQALTERLAAIWTDAMGFCGVEMHRRILGLAHNADFETIADPGRRALCEGRSLRLGRQLVRTRRSIRDMDEVCALARRIEEGLT
jgi:5-methylthioribose kinase